MVGLDLISTWPGRQGAEMQLHLVQNGARGWQQSRQRANGIVTMVFSFCTL